MKLNNTQETTRYKIKTRKTNTEMRTSQQENSYNLNMKQLKKE